MKKYKYLLIISLLLIINYSLVWASCDPENDRFWICKVTDTLKWNSSWSDENNFIEILDNIAWYIIGLFYFISVMLWIYAGFIILTSGWEDDRVKKWKNILIYVILWLIIIFLASQIINWVIDTLTETSNV